MLKSRQKVNRVFVMLTHEMNAIIATVGLSKGDQYRQVLLYLSCPPDDDGGSGSNPDSGG